MQAADPEKSGLALADCWSTADKIKLFPHLFLHRSPLTRLSHPLLWDRFPHLNHLMGSEGLEGPAGPPMVTL